MNQNAFTEKDFLAHRQELLGSSRSDSCNTITVATPSLPVTPSTGSPTQNVVVTPADLHPVPVVVTTISSRTGTAFIVTSLPHTEKNRNIKKALLETIKAVKPVANDSKATPKAAASPRKRVDHQKSEFQH